MAEMIKVIQGLLGVLSILLGIVAGFYVGVWLFSIGGILQIVDAVRAPTTEVLPIVIGIIRVVYAPFAGPYSFLILYVPGIKLLKNALT